MWHMARAYISTSLMCASPSFFRPACYVSLPAAVFSIERFWERGRGVVRKTYVYVCHVICKHLYSMPSAIPPYLCIYVYATYLYSTTLRSLAHSLGDTHHSQRGALINHYAELLKTKGRDLGMLRHVCLLLSLKTSSKIWLYTA